MKNTSQRSKLLLIPLLCLPGALFAQSAGIKSMHLVLEQTKQELMPLCSDLISVATAVAGFGALFYIAVRVWKHIANAEPIDFFPLFRPFVLTILIGMFPMVLNVMEGVLKPITMTTERMFTESNQSVEVLLKQRAISIAKGEVEEPIAIPGNGNRSYDKYDAPKPTEPGKDNSISFGFGFKLASSAFSFIMKLFLSTILQMVYYAASICIDVMRTFQLLILGILGPIVFALSIYDGFQHTLSIWIGRYVNVYLWLPISNIFGSLMNRIQANMLRLDMEQIQQGNNFAFSQTDAAYIIFLLISIIGYFSVPSIANFIIHASGSNALLGKTTQMAGQAAKYAAGGGAGAAASGAAGAASAAKAPTPAPAPAPPSGAAGSMANDTPGDDKKTSSMASAGNSEGWYRNDTRSYQAKKLS